MLTRQNKLLFKKLFSLFSVIRGYNIFIIIVAQYLSSIYILAPQTAPRQILLDPRLFVLVLASALSIAGGYIINNFYDSEKDLINRPKKTMLDRLVSQNTKLSVYFVLNIFAVVLASYVSFKATIFFSGYIFLIWFYSHKLKKHLFIGNITASILAIIPFFAVLIYYSNFNLEVFFHGVFLILIISMREITKDLENLKGDLAHNYKTIPVTYGVNYTKKLISLFALLTFMAIFILVAQFELGAMNYFFYLLAIVLLYYIIKLWRANSKSAYILLHNILKFVIVLGVFSMILIKPKLILNLIGI